mmetsp:Transcript_33481/g.77798  ORF Transcript_33481/g.77798 Transcript_33481/m.77798 type:complete len:635 (-) Transcript_33481:163-2067(-)|eukprot:CAMPEP_0171065836 /NCGR_PEP_ID=MMETSP0766_2-20121228/7072_1 /TAXON_ID=439317 /ORGANISM="Gambierdiscus australes, Strain CAWD 149" /LENGTH=634 /DNA_ID=CAMNT_0011521971 /DNA_START=62 /DNA_END=1966 /DNA_ORIENTATION=-
MARNQSLVQSLSKGYMSLDESGQSRPVGLPFFPPGVHHFDALFLRLVYHRMEHFGYINKEHKGVHVCVFRRCMRRLLDMFDSEIVFDFEAFGGHRKAVWLKWEDVRHALEEGRIPEVELSLPERVFMVLDGRMNSVLGIVWTSLMFVLIIANVVMIVMVSIPGYCTQPILLDLGGCDEFMDVLTVLFSVDYFGKLACAPYCRHALFNDEWLIEQVIVDPNDPNNPPPSQASAWHRLWYFVGVPLNIIDLISILPFWINAFFGFMHLQVGFFRSLRLLRLFRLFKFGKFSKTLLVLGDTFRKSSQSICVLILYIAMISLLAGAVIHRFEIDREDHEGLFRTVPSSLWWVVTRMVSMHSSLPGAKGFPNSWVSAMVVTWVGMFKGVIFVLPIGQITTAFKEAWANQEMHDRMQKQIEREKVQPLGSEWSKEPTAPTGRLELFHYLDGGGMLDLDAYGSLPLPIFTKTFTDSTIWIPLSGADMWTLCHNPLLQIQVIWKPDSDDTKEMLPQGQLLVRLLQGFGFPSAGKNRWGVKTSIPTGLYGNDSYEYFIAPPSSSITSMPTWDEGVCQSFEIGWADNIAGLKRIPSKETPEQDEAGFQEKVLALLESQAQRIQQLEKTLVEMKTLVEVQESGKE